MSPSKSGWKLHGNYMSELVLHCFHQDYFPGLRLLHVVKIFDDEVGVKGRINCLAHPLHIRHSRRNHHMQGKLRDGCTPFCIAGMRHSSSNSAFSDLSHPQLSN